MVIVMDPGYHAYPPPPPRAPFRLTLHWKQPFVQAHLALDKSAGCD
jgi:hypothetical protein